MALSFRKLSPSILSIYKILLRQLADQDDKDQFSNPVFLHHKKASSAALTNFSSSTVPVTLLCGDPTILIAAFPSSTP